MELDVSQELSALGRQTVTELRRKYAALFGEETRNRHRVWLIKRILWRMQALAEGDLSERARKRAEELARDADLRSMPPQPTRVNRAILKDAEIRVLERRKDQRLPPPGTLLVRRYKGENVQVEVFQSGFGFAGQIYPTLSAAAKAITGSHCNGFAFFKLGGAPNDSGQ